MTTEEKPATTDISKNLATKTIDNFMIKTLAYVTMTSSVRTAMQVMLTQNISGVPVVDDSISCLGFYSEMDALLQGASDTLDAKIKFAKPPKTIPHNMAFREALIFLVKNRIKRVPVVDPNNKLVGVLGRAEIMKALMNDSPAKEKDGA